MTKIYKQVIDGVVTYSGSGSSESMRNTAKAIKSLSKPRKRGNKPLPAAQARGEIRGKVGTGFPTAATGGGSIASPLTEEARTVRVYSDGEHDYSVAVESTFSDANGQEVIIRWLQPDSPNVTEG